MARWFAQFLDVLVHPRVTLLGMLAHALIGSAVAASASADLAGVTTPLFGVPLPVVLAAAGGAFGSWAKLSTDGYLAALGAFILLFFAGCAGAPILQAATITTAHKYFEADLAVPGGFLAFAALAIASIPVWWHWALPFLQRLPFWPKPEPAIPSNPGKDGAP